MCDISGSETLISSIYMTPTQHFKELCGGEWLNKKGMMTYANALDFVDWQFKQRGIKEKDGMIFLTEYFQTLFQDYRSFIYRKDIPELVKKFFK
jgi:hypothetical protein